MEEKNIQPAVDLFDKYALSYQTKFMDVSKYYKSLDLFCSLLPKKNTHILELACGPGNITKYIRAQRPDFDIIATDLSPTMLQLAKENNPDVSVQLLDCRSILDLESKFDAIVCGFGLPYVSKEDALKMISDSSNSLNQNGILYLSTMEDKYSNSGFKGSSSNPNEGLITYFHEAEYLIVEMNNQGIEVKDISRIKYVHNGEDVTDLVIIGQKL